MDRIILFPLNGSLIHPVVSVPSVFSSIGQRSFIEKLTFLQQQLRAWMVPLVRDVGTGHRIVPLLTVMTIAFVYGLVHAAGPGHGKMVAMSYVLSRKATVRKGIFFGIMTAFFHGFSAVICVLVIRYIIQAGFFGTFGIVTRTTQTVSYSLITLLGLGILVKSCYDLLIGAGQRGKIEQEQEVKTKWPLATWAITIGLIPCPGVVTVLLFCLSMNMLTLGVLLAGSISLGMACTISAVVIVAIKSREFSLGRVSRKRTKMVKGILGMGSGVAVTALGLLLLFLR